MQGKRNIINLCNSDRPKIKKTNTTKLLTEKCTHMIFFVIDVVSIRYSFQLPNIGSIELTEGFFLFIYCFKYTCIAGDAYHVDGHDSLL